MNAETSSFITVASILYVLLKFSSMVVCQLRTCFGKRKNLDSTNDEKLADLTSQTMFSSCATTTANEDEKENISNQEVHNSVEKESSTVTNCAETSSSNYFLSLGSDVMVSVVSYLDPRETLDLLTVPLCKDWCRSYTADQELWRTICFSKPFSADLPGGKSSRDCTILSYGRHNNDYDGSSSCAINHVNNASENESGIGEYRLIYTSFVQCIRYLDSLQNYKIGDEKINSDETHQVPRFSTFGVAKSLRKYLSRNSERSHLKSMIGNGTAADMSITRNGVSTDDRNILRDTSKAVTKEVDIKKPKYGNSMITSRLWGPNPNGVPSYLNLPKPCAIYSIVNWMVAHPNVPGIQIMCIQSLPSLLEDEKQRLVGRRVGLVEVILCAMLRFPDCVELHIAVFHAIVLLARPLGGREGMLFDDTMAETTENIGLTSLIELSDSVTLAARCGGHPNLKRTTNNRSISETSASDDSVAQETRNTGISILVDSMKRFSCSEKLQSMACWALVNVALVPVQKYLLMKLGGIGAILSAMEKHSKSFDVQFRALFALINLAVPCRQFDFVVGSNVNGADAARTERAVLGDLGPNIARLSVLAMETFRSSETILNRGCLVVHNLSQSHEFIPTLLETQSCYNILEWCLKNYSNDRVLTRSILSTLDRMRNYLDRHPEEQQRLSISIEDRNHESLDMYW